MKKLIFIMLAVFTFSFVNAQDMSMGIKAGLNYGANKTSDDDYNDQFDPMMGLHFGVFAEFELSDAFSVQPELMFTQSGANGKYFGVEDIKSDVNLRLNYLSIPIMAKYYVSEGFSLEAGPYLAFLLSATADGTIHNLPVGMDPITNEVIYSDIVVDKKDVSEEYKSTDFGIGVGAGYKMDNGLSFNLRYNLGLMDINDSAEKRGETDATKASGQLGTSSFTMANNIIQFSIGYKFM